MPSPATADAPGSPLVEVGRRAGGAVARLTLTSPHNRNALSRRLLAELAAGLADAGADGAVRAVVLAAEGRAFCSGADLAERLEDPSGGTPPGQPTFAEVLTAIATSSVPVVAEVGAPVRAGGMGLVAACDLAVAAASATFAFTEVRVGVAPAVIAVPALRVMDPRRLARHALTGEVFGADEAARCGLVTEVVPDDELAGTVDALCRALLEAAPGAVSATKELLARLRGAPWDEAMAEAEAASERLFAGAEAAEGMAAFLAKRPPSWRSA